MPPSSPLTPLPSCLPFSELSRLPWVKMRTATWAWEWVVERGSGEWSVGVGVGSGVWAWEWGVERGAEEWNVGHGRDCGSLKTSPSVRISPPPGLTTGVSTPGGGAAQWGAPSQRRGVWGAESREGAPPWVWKGPPRRAGPGGNPPPAAGKAPALQGEVPPPATGRGASLPRPPGLRVLLATSRRGRSSR